MAIRVARIYLHRSNDYLVAALTSEALTLAVFFAVYALALTISHKRLAIMLRAASFIFIIWMALDMLVFHLFWKRLDLADVRTFSQEYSANFAMMTSSFRSENIFPIILFLSTIIIPTSLAYQRPAPRWLVIIFGLFSIIFSIITSRAVELDTISNPQIVNTLTYNYKYNRRPEYSDEYLQGALQELNVNDKSLACISGRNLKSDIIIVMMESLSSYQSKKFSGLNDWTPNLDTIASDGIEINNFLANGFRTDLGLISTITGRWPIIPASASAEPYDAFYGIADALPRRLRSHGYQTSVISGSPLNFLKSKEWLQSIGFDETIGPDMNLDMRQRGDTLKAVFDDDLYDYVLHKISRSNLPFFQLVVTISSHPPYLNPLTGKAGEEEAFRYADHSFHQFYKKLRDINYFDRGGILMVMGDHRALVPISVNERKIFGASAAARIPLIIFGLDEMQISLRGTKGYFQQSDIPPSIEYLLSDQACFRVHQTNIFAVNQSGANCALHVRGDVAQYMNAFCGDQSLTIKFDGDKTRFLEYSPINANTVIAEIASSSVRLKQLRSGIR